MVLGVPILKYFRVKHCFELVNRIFLNMDWNYQIKTVRPYLNPWAPKYDQLWYYFDFKEQVLILNSICIDKKKYRIFSINGEISQIVILLGAL